MQAKFSKRNALGKVYNGKSVLSAKLTYEDCGGFFGSKVWLSTHRYPQTIWQCNTKFKNGEKCATPTVGTEAVPQSLIAAYNQMIRDRKQIIEDCKLMHRRLTDFTP